MRISRRDLLKGALAVMAVSYATDAVALAPVTRLRRKLVHTLHCTGRVHDSYLFDATWGEVVPGDELICVPDGESWKVEVWREVHQES